MFAKFLHCFIISELKGTSRIENKSSRYVLLASDNIVTLVVFLSNLVKF